MRDVQNGIDGTKRRGEHGEDNEPRNSRSTRPPGDDLLLGIRISL